VSWHWLGDYWHWAGSNIGAMPAEALITAIATAAFTVIFQRPLRRFVAWLREESREAREKARDDAEAARQIAADLYRHMTGEDHPVQNGK